MDKLLSNYQHFNSRTVAEAIKEWKVFHASGGRMFVTIAGAMSTAGIGKSLAPLIDAGYIAGISTTGANLEEDYYRAIGYDSYHAINDTYEITQKDDVAIDKNGSSRVYDTAIPGHIMEETSNKLIPHMQKAINANQKVAPHELFYKLIDENDPRFKDSWLAAAKRNKIFVTTPGWGDSTTGNNLVSFYRLDKIRHMDFIKSDLDQMNDLVEWYQGTSKKHSIGFFQLGGGIAGDFPICVVPLINIDLKGNVPKWGYFCQIGDSTLSYGSYSGAHPSEKISWGKLEKGTPMFAIQSDASIVAPLMFQAVLEK